MSPFEISMLLHIYCRPAPFENAGFPAHAGTIESFLRDDLIEPDDGPSGYRLLPRGRAYVHFLLAMPLPHANWTLPGPWAPSFPPPQVRPDELP